MKTLFMFVLLFSIKSLATDPIKQLNILESYTVPAREISGMSWRQNPETKKRELILVGDQEHKLYIIDWENRKTKWKVTMLDLPHPSNQKKSEWESVYSDESGRVFITREFPAQLIVVSSDLKKIEATIDLVIPPGSTGNNSGGEGLMPLINGHLLLVKEKDPIQIIELGPKGDKAAGYSSALSIEKKGHFQIPSNPFVSLQTWRFDEATEKHLEDASGLNSDSDGLLYVLSDQKQMIGLLGPSLSVSPQKLHVEKYWSLPREIKQPEGMVIDEQKRPLIAIDRKNSKKPNLYLLSEMSR